MNKLPMCRICLIENVRMDVVVNKYLHEVYEKLTDIPFVTEDSRPILVCFVCFAQLQKCYRLRTKCLEAEERFAQIINGNYERKPLINQDHLELFHGFINSPIQSINIVDVGQNESMIVKEELSTDFQRLEDIIEPKEEHQSDDGLEAKNLYDNYLDIEYIPPHHSELDSEDDVPLMEFKTEAEDEQEVSENKRKAKKTNSLEAKNLYENYLDIYIPPHHSDLDSEDDVPLMEFKTEAVEEQEVSENKRKAKKTNSTSTKRLRHNEDNILEDYLTAEHFHVIEENVDEDGSNKNSTMANENNKTLSTETNESLKEIARDENKQDCKQNASKPKYECETCQKTFSTSRNLKEHVTRQHNTVWKYNCDYCLYKSNQIYPFKQHVGKHTNTFKYSCEKCPFKTNYGRNFRKHCIRHENNKESPSFAAGTNFPSPKTCDLCHFKTCSRKVFSNHMSKHKGNIYRCDKCPYGSHSKYNLSRHVTRIGH